MAIYKIGDKEVTEEEFNSKIRNAPFFLDEFVGSPTPSETEKIWLSNNTGYSTFTKLQDHPLSDYLDNTTVKFQILDLTDIDPIAVYNDIVGHSTRHKAGKEIKPEDIWNEEKRKAVSQAIKKDIQSQNPEQKQQVKDLAEQYKKEDESIGKKETEGKLDYSEINFELLDLMAERFMKNKSKYPKGNTLKQINKEDLVFAAFRHLRKMIKPIKDDPESFKDHLVAISTNMSILLDQLNLEENE